MDDLFDGVRAVLFDMDGTLVETNIDFSLMRREMFAIGARYGVDPDDLVGLDILAIVDFIESQLSGDNAASARREAFAKLEEIELLHSDDASPIEGAHEVLRALHDVDIRTAIVTRNCRAAVEICLGMTGIAADALLTRDDVVRAKPHPEHLLAALEMLRIPATEAVTVGDHWMDVQGGRAAGTRTIGFLRPDRPENFFERERPDLVIHSLAELLDPIARLKK